MTLCACDKASLTADDGSHRSLLDAVLDEALRPRKTADATEDAPALAR